MKEIIQSTEKLIDVCHGIALESGWWTDLETGLAKERNVGELLMLCVSELAEAMEGYRKDLPDDHLVYRKAFEVEIADCVIRLMDLAGGMNLDLGNAISDKLEYNRNRADHKIKERLKQNGKKF